MRCPSCGYDNPECVKFCGECGTSLQAAGTCPRCGSSNPEGVKFCHECGQRLVEPAPQTPPPTPAPSPTLPSSFAAGRYEVKRFLGEGGWKRVYLAHDTKLDSDVAFALIKTEGLDAEGLTRIRREAQAMGRLRDHPHIVTVFDIGEERGQPYIVSQHMAGGELKELLEQVENNRLPLDDALRIADQVCQALEYAHGRGIIHRDLKPGNVFLTQTGEAKLGDFGLAVAMDRSRLTQAGMMMGTVAYMPPEQALGREADARSDLYSLGATLYEMVTGRPPFLGDDAVAVISQHINTAPVAPSWHNPEVPRALEALIMRLLAKAPGERPESAAAVAQELRRIRESSTEQRLIEPPVAPAAALQGVDWGRFVGRGQEMDQLKAALENALSGRGSLVMIVGEPGIGKTRLAEEFGVYAGLRGAQVLTGRCYEGEVALPYRPFVEAFRQYVRDRPDLLLRQELGEGAPEVAKLASEVRRRFPDIPEAPPLEPDAERLRLFESVTSFVRNAAAANPLVLLLDDLHWSDKPSLLLLRYLARSVAGERVLILGAYRDVELDRTHPLSDVIATLRREQLYRRILLRGLLEEDVLSLLAAMDPSEEGTAARQALAAALYRETEGNPFFIREVLSHLVEEGKLYREGGRWTSKAASISELGIPEGVREVVGRRLSRLSDGCNRILTLASTMTGGFSWEELRAITGESEAALLDLLDEALAAQLIQERTGDGAGTYDFTHAIIRQTLYGELSTPRRVILHRQIGQALEELHADNLEPHLAELAHHFYQAAPGGDVDKAIDYAARAAERALSLTGYEEAAGLYALALQALELKDRADEAQRCELLLALGDAQWKAGNSVKAKDTFQRAADVARKLEMPEQLARAAVGFGGPWGEAGIVDEPLIDLLEEALGALGEGDSALRARVLARLAVAVYWTGSLERREELSREAVNMARRIGDPATLRYALGGRGYVLIGLGNLEERLATSTEIVQQAEKYGDREIALRGHLMRLISLLELGDIPAVDVEVEAMARLAEELRQPFSLYYTAQARTMRALLEGRFEDGERLARQALATGQRVGDLDAGMRFESHMFILRSGLGGLEESEPAVKSLVEQYPALSGWRCALALLYSQLDREAETRSQFEDLAANDFADLPQDMVWLSSVANLAQTCSFLRDARRAATLYELLLPYAGRNVSSGAVSCAGSASYHLGLLAATMSRWEEAAQHFEDALAMHDRMGARPFLARTQYQYAWMLQERDQPGDPSTGSGSDRERAQALVNQALATFEELRMKKDVERALGLKLQLQGIDPTTMQSSIGAVASAVYVDKPDLRPHAAPDGTVTLLFTDIEGSTAMTERLGDQRWLELVRTHNAIVREQVGAHEGFEVKTIGDGFMVAFGSARRALQCAIDIQRAFAAHNEELLRRAQHDRPEPRAEPVEAPVEGPIKVRIGLHTGEAVKEAEDFYGRHVVLASRIADEAQGGEILASDVVRQLVAGKGFLLSDRSETALRGFEDPVRLYEVRWREA